MLIPGMIAGCGMQIHHPMSFQNPLLKYAILHLTETISVFIHQEAPVLLIGVARYINLLMVSLSLQMNCTPIGMV